MVCIKDVGGDGFVILMLSMTKSLKKCFGFGFSKFQRVQLSSSTFQVVVFALGKQHNVEMQYNLQYKLNFLHVG